jgi:ABC-type dipeptide/oligopeptide/nickel transport system permease subunit
MPVLPGREKRKIYARKIRSFWEDFSHNRIGLVGLFLILIYVFVAIFASWMTPYPAVGAPRVANGYAMPSWMTIFPQNRDLPPTMSFPLNWTPTQEYEAITMGYGTQVTLNYTYYPSTGEIGEFQNYTFQVLFNYSYRKPGTFESLLAWNAQFRNVSYRLEAHFINPLGEEYYLFGRDYNEATKHVEILKSYWNITSANWMTTSGTPDLCTRMVYEDLFQQYYQQFHDSYLKAFTNYEEYYQKKMKTLNDTYIKYHDKLWFQTKYLAFNLSSFDSFWFGLDSYWNVTGINEWATENAKYESDAHAYAEPLAALQADSEARLFSPTQAFFSSTGTCTIRLRLIVQPLSENSTLKITFGEKNRFRIWGSIHGLLGADSFGGDVFAQLVYGARISLFVGILSAILSTSLGIFFGVTSGYLGGIVDELTMRVVDILLCLPLLPILLALIYYFKPNVYFVVLLIAIFGWQGLARVIRSRVLSLREMPFVESARASGASNSYLITRHLIPNVFPIAISSMILAVPAAILTEAALSFLGFGDPFAATWGKMLHEAQTEGAFKALAWWYILPPGFAITFLCVAFVFVGHALDEIVNPRLRRRR